MLIVKWLGTTAIIIATVLRALDYHIADMAVGFIGTALWGYASYIDKDHALLTCNVFILIVLLYGLIT